ncbi:MAG: sulfatase-like hydrolase/transferase [Deltaproteobacteria bacterium]|nr:sulfatase-like hydrolase/transferase [Deltaproteobacteria bacterium]
MSTGLPALADAHIVLITVDALRADHLGLYGYDRGTSPELDAFAEQAVVFEHAYAAAPHSSYSLSSLMTSEYLHETVELGLPLPTDTLPSILGQAGYRTAGFYTLGIFHTDGERLALYRDEAYGLDLHDHASMNAEQRTDRVLEEVDRIVAAGEPPSFLWVHYFDVHEPYEETRLGSGEMDRYDGEIQNADRAFGRLVRELERRLEHPIVFAVTADHGEEFREHGGVYHGSSVYEEQERVPLLIRAPGITPARVQQPVELVDLAPTLLGLVDLPAPASMRGDDLRPLLAGQEFDPGPAFAAVSHLRMVVDWPYKLVANLRFGLYELYDLEHDPHERVNLASRDETRRDALAAEIYGWLDSLESPEQDPRQHALELGRLGDRRAVPVLLELLADGAAETSDRQEAARILARLADPASAPGLLLAMQDADPMVAAEATVALGRQYDARAHDALVPLVSAEDPELRTRAAVSLGRLRDPRAVPALLDALYVSHDSYEREEAVRWLGRLGDPRAVEPLIALLPEFRIRYLTVVALGMLGDRRAYDPLTQMLDWETHSNVRDNVGRALGQLGDPRAIPLLIPLAASEAESKYVPEALVRLGAIESGAIGGADAHRSPGPRGFGHCEEGPVRQDWDYLNRTHCQSRGPEARVRLRVPPALRGVETLLLLRLRRADDDHRVELELRLGDTRTTLEVDGRWVSHRLRLPPGPTGRAGVWLELSAREQDARLDLDHALLLPVAASDGAAHD